MAAVHRETIQKQIQQDWANREYIEVITGSIKKITDFLNSFGELIFTTLQLQFPCCSNVSTQCKVMVVAVVFILDRIEHENYAAINSMSYAQ